MNLLLIFFALDFFDFYANVGAIDEAVALATDFGPPPSSSPVGLNSVRRSFLQWKVSGASKYDREVQ